MTSTTSAVEHGSIESPTDVSATVDTEVVSPIGDTEQPATIRHAVPGWQRPLWATSVSYDDARVCFEYATQQTFIEDGGRFPGHDRLQSIEVGRTDQVVADGEQGSISILEGVPMVHLDVEELTVPEARKLVSALLELLDAVDNPDAARSAVVL